MTLYSSCSVQRTHIVRLEDISGRESRRTLLLPSRTITFEHSPPFTVISQVPGMSAAIQFPPFSRFPPEVRVRIVGNTCGPSSSICPITQKIGLLQKLRRNILILSQWGLALEPGHLSIDSHRNTHTRPYSVAVCSSAHGLRSGIFSANYESRGVALSQHHPVAIPLSPTMYRFNPSIDTLHLRGPHRDWARRLSL